MSFMSRKFILDEPGLNIMRPGDADVYRDLGTALSVGGSLIGGLMSSKASSNAADTQAASADAATAEQRRQYDLTRGDSLNQYNQARTDNAPFLATGTGANQRLATLLGIRQPLNSQNGNFAGSSTAGAPDRQKMWDEYYANADKVHQQMYGIPLAQSGDQAHLSAQMTWMNNAVDAQYAAAKSAWDAKQGQATAGANDAAFNTWLKGQGDRLNGIDPANLTPTQLDWFQNDYANKTGFAAGSHTGNNADNSTDPEFGSLNKTFQTHNFSTADLNADPVYQSGLKFGLDTGTNAINARAIANGGYDSGATLKALTQFGNDYGSTKANESYNRYTNDQTNAYNRFNTDQGNTYNRLAGVSGAGQNAVNTVTNAGANMVNTIANSGANSANNISNNITGAGNARAAGIVGGSQAWGSAAQGINGAVNNYQSQQTLQALLRRGGGGYTGVGINGGYPNDGWTGY